MEYQLPPHAVLSGWATKELGKLRQAGALLAAFKAYADGTNLPRQYAPYPIGKNRMLHEARETDCGQELRLIFGRVRPRQPPPDGTRLPAVGTPIRLIGLVATDKKKRHLRGAGSTTWTRLQLWLEVNESYQLDGTG